VAKRSPAKRNLLPAYGAVWGKGESRTTEVGEFWDEKDLGASLQSWAGKSGIGWGGNRRNRPLNREGRADVKVDGTKGVGGAADSCQSHNRMLNEERYSLTCRPIGADRGLPGSGQSYVGESR